MQDGGTNFDHPPVQTTVLTVFFEPITLFDLTFIMPLQQRWAERYPELKQKAPRGRPYALPDVEVGELGSTWPFPAVEQQNREMGRKISYQADQISLTWQLEKEAIDPGYPGFNALFNEFRAVLREFVERVEAMAKPIVVQGARCNYENYFEHIDGIDYIAQYLSDFNGVNAVRRMTDTEYVGFRFNKESIDSPAGSAISVGVQLDVTKDRLPTLDIDVTAVPIRNSPIDGGDAQAAAVQLIDDAHNALIDTFMESVSADMQRTWGKG